MKKILAFTLLLCSVVGVVHGQGKNKVVVATYDAEPWVIRNAEGEYEGVTSQFSKIVEMVSDLEVEVRPMPFQMLALEGRNSDVDIVISYYQPQLARHSEMLATAGKIRNLLVTRDHKDVYFGEEKNKNLKIGVMRGAIPALRNIVPEWWNLVEVTSEAVGIRKLQSNQLNAMIMTDAVYKYQTTKNKKYDEFNTHLIGFVKLHVWVNKENVNAENVKRYVEIVDKVTFDGKMVIRWMKIDKILDLFKIGR